MQHGDIAFFEVGACFNRYHAAKMHTVYVGSEPPTYYKTAEAQLQRALAAGRRACVDGALARHVDAAMRAEVGDIESMPYWMSERSGYSIGTGLATDWSEKVLLIDPSSEAIVRDGMTIHLIPWIQVERVGAIGFSDTVLVGGAGTGAPATSLFEYDAPKFYERAVRVHHNPTPSHDALADKAGIEAAIAFHRTARTAPTPLSTVHLPGGPRVHIKDESARCGLRAFKALGVKYAVERLFASGELKAGDTVASMTDGNHGEALAVVGRQRGLKVVIFLPHNVCADRLAVLRRLGADTRKLRGSYDNCIELLRKESERNGWVIVADSSWEGYESVPMHICEGYSLVFHEAMQQLLQETGKPPTHVLIQAGVGGLLAAGAAYFSTYCPSARIVSVEPIDAGCILENAREGRGAHELRACEGATDSNMQGLNCGTPSPVTWPLITSHVHDYLAIGDDFARAAVRSLYHDHRLSVSESGAAGFAGLLAAMSLDKETPSTGIDASSRVLVVLTEGVTNGRSFNEIIGSKRYTSTPEEVAMAIAERCGISLPPADATSTTVASDEGFCFDTSPQLMREMQSPPPPSNSSHDGSEWGKSSSDDVPEPCPVCLGILHAPVTLGCAHSLCGECMTLCSDSGHSRCPVCRVPHLLDPSQLAAKALAYRAKYASWRKAGHRGAVGEVASITKPISASALGPMFHLGSAGLLFNSMIEPPPPPPSCTTSPPKARPGENRVM